MTPAHQRRIVVGFDGSDEATDALAHALDLAGPLGASLDVVTTWKWPTNWSAAPVTGSWSPLHDAEEIRTHADELVADHASTNADGTTGTAEVTTRTVEGNAAEELIRAAEGADLLIVGNRGRGGFAGLVLGSVSAACMRHATCPVLVHRRPSGATTARTIVVGVDGSHESGQALRFAVTFARLLGYSVTAITTWQWPSALNRDEPPFDHWTPEADARATASSALDAAADLLDDDVELTSELREGPAAEVLVEASGDAAFLVLGNRGLGGFRGLLLGSVSQECAARAACSVVIQRG